MRKPLLVVLIASLAFGACKLSNPDIVGGNDGSPDDISTVPFAQQDDNSYLFMTNDPANITAQGKTFFCYDPSIRPSGAFSYSVKIHKDYGDQNGGFGLIFQRIDTMNFWVFNIDVRGYYFLVKISKGNIVPVFSPAWKESTSIKKGYGSVNEIKIVYDGDVNYVVYANGLEVVSFSDTISDPPLKGGCFGLDAVIMSTEHFPETPVRVSYEFLDPVTINVSSEARYAALDTMEGLK